MTPTACAFVMLASAASVHAAETFSVTSIQLSQDTQGVPDVAERQDFFGAELTTGDFDGDGRDDLVVSSALEDYFVGRPGEATVRSGSVTVVYGTDSGSDGSRTDVFSTFDHFDEAAEEGENFGGGLAAGDFNGDGFDDLAIGAPGRDDRFSDNEDVGAVFVLFGSIDGLTDTDAQFFDQETPGVDDVADEIDFFGGSIAAGDFDNDGFDDLAVGAQGNDVGAVSGAGRLHLISGSEDGLDTESATSLHQGSPGIAGLLEGDHFGSAVTTGDFDGDGFADVAVQSRLEAVGDVRVAGMVHVLYGSSSGITGTNSTPITQASPGVSGTPEFGDQFGSTLASGDIDGDGADELLVGTPDEAIGDVDRAGLVHVFPGSSGGTQRSSGTYFHEARPGIVGTVTSGDDFGAAMSVADLDGDGYADLAIGTPGGGVGSGYGSPGVAHVLFGDGSGNVDPATDRYLSQGTDGVTGASEFGDRFATRLVVGDFDGDGNDELAVGNPRESIGSLTLAGNVHVVDWVAR